MHVDLSALAANYRWCCDHCEGAATVGGVVKADGYGLGMAAVATTLYVAGCREFFVATSEEGRALREVLGDARIYVFEGVTSHSAEELATFSLIPVINHPGQLEAWRQHRRLPIAVHVDTGMARLGFADDVSMRTFSGFDVTLLVTHLVCADTPDHAFNEEQVRHFAPVAARFPGIRTSVGNSAAVLLGARFVGDLGRPGIGLYGGNPFSDRPNPMRSVATLSAPVLQVRSVAVGRSLGYGASYVAPEDLQVATVGIGYADGLPRLLSNRGEAWVGGRRCAIVGRVSMDLTLVEVSGLQVDPGDRVQFFGERVAVDEVATWAETISYEVLTGIGARVERVYVNR